MHALDSKCWSLFINFVELAEVYYDTNFSISFPYFKIRYRGNKKERSSRVQISLVLGFGSAFVFIGRIWINITKVSNIINSLLQTCPAFSPSTMGMSGSKFFNGMIQIYLYTTDLQTAKLA